MKALYLFSVFSVFILSNCNTISKNPDNTETAKTEMSFDILETYWKVVEINGQAVINPLANQQEAHIILKKELNRIQGNGGCNNLMGTYELLEGNRVKFSGVASTKMACPDMSIEGLLGQAIEMADNYAINGKHLMLYKAKMAPLLKLEAKE